MVILDTDHMSLLERSTPEGSRIWERLRTVPADDAATTVVSYEEQTRGWLARIAAARTAGRQVAAYRELKRQLRNYCLVTVLDYDEAAADQFEKLRSASVRIGTMDLKIAAIATDTANDATLPSRNLSDFQKVPGLQVEDWSV